MVLRLNYLKNASLKDSRGSSTVSDSSKEFHTTTFGLNVQSSAVVTMDDRLCSIVLRQPASKGSNLSLVMHNIYRTGWDLLDLPVHASVSTKSIESASFK